MRNSRKRRLLAGGLLSVVLTCAYALSAGAQVQRISPPEDDFYAKETDCMGVKIKAPEVVADAALTEAATRLHMMLGNVPEIRSRLIESGCEMHIIGKNQETSDLPECRRFKGKPFGENETDIDKRTRGVGGKCASCGEENLLHLSPDRYADRDICVHEFAHTIMSYGVDSGTRDRIEDRYTKSTIRGLWKDMYAGKNKQEFFAELTMWYFGTRGDYGKCDPPPKPGPEWLRSYDPEAFQLLNEIYRGPIAPEKWPEPAQTRWPTVGNRSSIVTLQPRPASEESSIRSSASIIKTTLLFFNTTAGPVHLNWLNFEGKRVDYGVIPASQTKTCQTFATHAWAITDSNGNCIAIFIAPEQSAAAYIR